MLWTFPTTAVGLMIALPATLFGARWQVREGVLECYGGLVGVLLRRGTLLPGGAMAITFGDLILGRNAEALEACRYHEQVHVRQAHRWGPFFIPAYLLASVWVQIHRKKAYWDNPFEVEAYRISTRSIRSTP